MKAVPVPLASPALTKTEIDGLEAAPVPLATPAGALVDELVVTVGLFAEPVPLASPPLTATDAVGPPDAPVPLATPVLPASSVLALKAAPVAEVTPAFGATPAEALKAEPAPVTSSAWPFWKTPSGGTIRRGRCQGCGGRCCHMPAMAYVFRMRSAIVTRVTVVAESTLKRNQSPAEKAVVQPVSVVSWDFVVPLMVGFAEAVIVSAIVGG